MRTGYICLLTWSDFFPRLSQVYILVRLIGEFQGKLAECTVGRGKEIMTHPNKNHKILIKHFKICHLLYD